MFMVGKRTFPEYVMKRLIKDKIGFQPQENWKGSFTDYKTLISAPLAQNPKDFLVYCHELGHCKSYQPEQNLAIQMLGVGVTDVSKGSSMLGNGDCVISVGLDFR